MARLTQRCLTIMGGVLLLAGAPASAAFRFPRPDFERDYQYPVVAHSSADPVWLAWLDVSLLALALLAGTWLVLKKRSRAWLWALMASSLAYFGFYREGCICPIGAIQNVALGIADPSYAVPISVVAFFALPLLFALCFGRIFCAAVCPLGAIQDMFLLRPVNLPTPLVSALRIVPYLYLAVAVMFAAGGSGFLICRYDPFVAMFRLSGESSMLAFGGLLLAIGTMVGRPYCRFLCPYGVLLNWTSRFAWRHATITPDTCITCRLCDKACPFGSIQPASLETFGETVSLGTRRTGLLVLALPILMLLGWGLGLQLGPALARLDSDVQTAEQVWREDGGVAAGTTLRSDAFRTLGRSTEVLYQDAVRRRQRYGRWGGILGAFAGLMIGAKLIAHSRRTPRNTYEIDPATCFSCARCFASCPREQLRRGVALIPTEARP